MGNGDWKQGVRMEVVDIYFECDIRSAGKKRKRNEYEGAKVEGETGLWLMKIFFIT
jgi:hypothetical protein